MPIATPTWDLPIGRRATVEAVGTFALVFAGTGAVAVDSLAGSLGAAGVAAAFGLVVMIVVFSTGHLSGAHINPAVTLGFFAIRRISARDATLYVLAQLIGAVAASLTIRAALGADASLGVTRPELVGVGGALGIEVILTALLMFVIVSVATDPAAHPSTAGLAIGGTVGVAALVMGPVTGASMNPARSFAPALVSGDMTDLWIYLVAPAIGACAGVAVYRRLARRS